MASFSSISKCEGCRDPGKCELYEVVMWPECQELMDKEGWENNSYLISDDRGLNDFGSSAYFVKKSWLEGANSDSHDIQD